MQWETKRGKKCQENLLVVESWGLIAWLEACQNLAELSSGLEVGLLWCLLGLGRETDEGGSDEGRAQVGEEEWIIGG